MGDRSSRDVVVRMIKKNKIKELETRVRELESAFKAQQEEITALRVAVMGMNYNNYPSSPCFPYEITCDVTNSAKEINNVLWSIHTDL